MNLINDKWIPVERQDGSEVLIAPWEIGQSENPVVEIKTPRPDFRGALYQFLIGLVQTTFAPEEQCDWNDLWEDAPSCETLKKAFEPYAENFELYKDTGPAFMQDLNMPEDANEMGINSLLIDAPGENTIVLNKDHFVKRNQIKWMCPSCAASALLTLQINAPSGGQGYRTGLRGGGPLTTLVVMNNNSTLWNKIWLNIINIEELSDFKKPYIKNAKVFPWLDETILSINNKQVYPKDAEILQQFWSMPRRIRFEKAEEQGTCDICGKENILYEKYITKNYGVSYSSTWQHVLSPYRTNKNKEGLIELLAIKGKQGGLTYLDWLPITLLTNSEKMQVQVASVVKSFLDYKKDSIKDIFFSVWCFGYDMDNMKARCWYEKKMPLFNIPEKIRNKYIDLIIMLTQATQQCIYILKYQIKAAWSDTPKDLSGDMTFIDSTFYTETEDEFYKTADIILKKLTSEEPSVSNELESWRKYIINTAMRLFARFALQDTDDIKNMKRAVKAENFLKLNLNKDKQIYALKELK